MWDIPTDADMTRYLNNIRTLRGLVADVSAVPQVPTTMNKLTYTTANNIEKIILAAAQAVGG
jgi:hypothetical protein